MTPDERASIEEDPLDVARDAICQRYLTGKISDTDCVELLAALPGHTRWLATNVIMALDDRKAGIVTKAPVRYRIADAKEPDGVARKCFTCAGWSSGRPKCTVCRFNALSYYVCNLWRRAERLNAHRDLMSDIAAQNRSVF